VTIAGFAAKWSRRALGSHRQHRKTERSSALFTAVLPAVLQALDRGEKFASDPRSFESRRVQSRAHFGIGTSPTSFGTL